MLSKFSGKFKLLDINLRKKCYTGETLESSLEQATILKLNEEELVVLVGLFGLQGASAPNQAEHLLKHAGLKYCVVTLGDRGTLALSHRGEIIYRPGYQVSLIDPCGSGDGFTAGFIHGLLEGGSLNQACRLGNALGAMVAQQEGATQPISYQETMAFMEAGCPGVIDERLSDLMEQ